MCPDDSLDFGRCLRSFLAQSVRAVDPDGHERRGHFVGIWSDFMGLRYQSDAGRRHIHGGVRLRIDARCSYPRRFLLSKLVPQNSGDRRRYAVSGTLYPGNVVLYLGLGGVLVQGVRLR